MRNNSGVGGQFTHFNFFLGAERLPTANPHHNGNLSMKARVREQFLLEENCPLLVSIAIACINFY